MTGPDNTPVETLMRAAETGVAAGLKFVYAGNLPGRVGGFENTYCPGCKALLIERYGFRILKNAVPSGACPSCGLGLPGRWERSQAENTDRTDISCLTLFSDAI